MQEEILKLRNMTLETDEKEDGFFIDLNNPFGGKEEPEKEKSERGAVDVDKLDEQRSTRGSKRVHFQDQEIDEREYLTKVQKFHL